MCAAMLVQEDNLAILASSLGWVAATAGNTTATATLLPTIAFLNGGA
jgi:hypothetical protein